jgi:hypothetical protein
MADPLETITEGCFLALRFGKRISQVPTGNFSIEEGMYWLGHGKTYHPLESALVGVDSSGDWRQDVATVLGVDARWVSGFLDGFAQEPESSTDGEYTQGYLAAEELRVARYRTHLPDRR